MRSFLLALSLCCAAHAGPAAAEDIGRACVAASEADAVEACTRAIATGGYPEPIMALMFEARARGHSDLGAYDLAVADLDAALRLDPESDTALASRGLVWSARGDYDKAVADFTAAIRRDPTNADYFMARASAWLGKRDLDRALADCDAALRLHPDDRLIQERRASIQKLKDGGAAGDRQPRG